MKLHLAEDLALPLDVVTQTIAIVAKRRAGKSYTMRRLVEQLLQARQQVVLVDPKGDQWGIRSAADGKAPGLAVVILGGERGDVPLEPGSGEVVAKLVVVERVSVVLDLSLFRKHEVATFMTGFLENLYRLKAKEAYRTPMMLVIDEADAIAPQKPQKGEERMLGAAEDIVRRGGQRGIGCVLVTQRSAVLNKNVLTQAQMLVALRTIAPQDLAAMDDWIKVHGEPGQRETLMESLPSLPVGDAWLWSPGWPTVEGIFKRVHVLPIETFDSGATPKPGETRAEPKSPADVDLDALKRQMASTIEKAKADDPRLLKAEIARLKAEAAKKPVSAVQNPDPVAIAAARQEGREEGAREGYAAGLRAVQPIAERLGTFKLGVMEQVDAFQQDLRRLAAAYPAQNIPKLFRTERMPERLGSAAVKHSAQFAKKRNLESSGASGSVEVGNSGLRRILIALAQRPQGLTQRGLGVRAGLSSRSGTFATYLSKGRSEGWILGSGNQAIRMTDAGLKALGSYEPLPEGRELLAYWLGELDGGAARILQALAEVYPHAHSREDTAARANLSAASGTFATYLSKLRTLELISGKGELRASEELFDG